MNIKVKSFPYFLFILMMVLFYSLACRTTHEKIIGKKQFIEIYARLLIIDEMDLTVEYKDRLRTELMQQNKITRVDIEKTINYYNTKPEEWIEILGKTRDRIEQWRTSKLTQTAP